MPNDLLPLLILLVTGVSGALVIGAMLWASARLRSGAFLSRRHRR